MYTPRVPPSAEGDRLRWLVEEFRAINQHLNTKSVPIWRIAQTHVTPDKPRDGDVRYCDGTDLDFGHGIGPYIYEEADSAWHPMFDVPLWDLHFFAPGAYDASEVLLALTFIRNVSWPANLSGSYAKCLVSPSTTVSMALTKNGTTFGAISISSATTNGTFSTTATSFVAGDVLQLIAPGTANTTLAGVSIAVKATR